MAVAGFLRYRYYCSRRWRSIASADLMELRLLRADMNLLMTISVIGAVILGDWFEAALAVAVIADTGTSLIVTASGMRLFRSKLN